MRFCSGKASKTFFRNYLLPLDTFRRNFFDAFPWDNLFWLFLAFFDPAWTVDCSREGNSSTGQKQCFRPYRLDDRKAQPEMGELIKYVQVQVTGHWPIYLAHPFHLEPLQALVVKTLNWSYCWQLSGIYTTGAVLPVFNFSCTVYHRY